MVLAICNKYLISGHGITQDINIKLNYGKPSKTATIKFSLGPDEKSTDGMKGCKWIVPVALKCAAWIFTHIKNTQLKPAAFHQHLCIFWKQLAIDFLNTKTWNVNPFVETMIMSMTFSYSNHEPYKIRWRKMLEADNIQTFRIQRFYNLRRR